MCPTHDSASLTPLSVLIIALTASVTSSFSFEAECELPTFSNVLPFRYRNQLKIIWKDTKEGAIECQTELKQTLKVIDSLPDNLKLRITDYRAPTLRGGRMHFLTGLLPGEVVQFSQIMRNRSISEDKRIELLRLWASDKLSVDASDYFEKFVKIHAERTARFQKKVDRLSEEAKLAFSRLQAINKEKQNIVTGLSPRAKNELATLWNLKCRNVRRPSTTFEADGPDLDADELSLSCTTSSGVLTRLRPTDRGSQTPSTAALEMPTKSDPRQVENAPDVEWHTFWQKLFSLHSATPTS